MHEVALVGLLPSIYCRPLGSMLALIVALKKKLQEGLGEDVGGDQLMRPQVDPSVTALIGPASLI